MLNKYLLVVLLIAAVLRFTGINWDQGQHLHPDERFLTMVATTLQWPASMPEYFDTAISPLNPHNIGYDFYVYGTWPVIFVRWVAESIHMQDYGGLTLVGRALSALADLVVVAVVYFLTYALTRHKGTALLASLWYALSVLPIQLAHFYTTDPYVTLFAVLTVFTAVVAYQKKFPVWIMAVCGLCLGLAAAAKISAGLVFPPLFLLFFVGAIKEKKFIKGCIGIAVLLIVAGITVRVGYPYLFDGWQLNALVLANWRELSSYNHPGVQFPPATMWITTKPFLFPMENIVLWGLGIPLALLTGLGMIWALFSARQKYALWFVVLPIICIFGYQGYQYSKNMRYLYVLYPLFAVAAALLWERISHYKWSKFVLALVIVLVAIWPVSFMRIYAKPHSRVTASTWIYTNIPVGSHISCEHWDDCLPLNLEGYPGNGAYVGVAMPMFNPDTAEKWTLMSERLASIDYLILSSNRVYGSTMTVPERYPLNSKFYSLLFSGSLGFQKVAEFTSRPGIEWLPGHNCLYLGSDFYGRIARNATCLDAGLSIMDDFSEEAFTVYDHPKVVIFKKVQPVNYLQLFVKS